MLNIKYRVSQQSQKFFQKSFIDNSMSNMAVKLYITYPGTYCFPVGQMKMRASICL